MPRITKSSLRVGARRSALSQWQAHHIITALNAQGYAAEAIWITTEGDQNTEQPLHTFSEQGVFTRALDTALIEGRIDIAVHSMKDLPTTLTEGITLAMVSARDTPYDILVQQKNTPFLPLSTAIIATGSIRRRAQWQHRYPLHQFAALRGNIPTRLAKFHEHNWDGLIISQASLIRLGITNYTYQVLKWMLPAPAQGIICATARKDDLRTLAICATLNDTPTLRAATTERAFLHALGAGCSLPIGGLAQCTEEGLIHFQGNALSTDGKLCFQVTEIGTHPEEVGNTAAQKLLDRIPSLTTLLTPSFQ